MAITSLAYPRPARTAPSGGRPGRTPAPDHLTAVGIALHAARLAAGNDPRIMTALDLADRQAKALADGLQGRGRTTPS